MRSSSKSAQSSVNSLVNLPIYSERTVVLLRSMTTSDPGLIDRLDAALIELLAAEPRIGVLEASRRLGVARGTVQARLDRLAARGVITGDGPEGDPAALGPGGAGPRRDRVRHAGDPPARRARPGGRAAGRDPGGAGGAHDHRLQRHAVPGGGPDQRR